MREVSLTLVAQVSGPGSKDFVMPVQDIRLRSLKRSILASTLNMYAIVCRVKVMCGQWARFSRPATKGISSHSWYRSPVPFIMQGVGKVDLSWPMSPYQFEASDRSQPSANSSLMVVGRGKCSQNHVQFICSLVDH